MVPVDVVQRHKQSNSTGTAKDDEQARDLCRKGVQLQLESTERATKDWLGLRLMVERMDTAPFVFMLLSS
jgi:hypothetical protein